MGIYGKYIVGTVIGNDMWIGECVRILEGVAIGDGAIIVSGLIVTKDVDTYTIIGEMHAKKP